MIVTLGSDFHAKDGIHPEIGLIGEELEISDDFIDKIVNDLIY